MQKRYVRFILFDDGEGPAATWNRICPVDAGLLIPSSGAKISALGLEVRKERHSPSSLI